MQNRTGILLIVVTQNSRLSEQPPLWFLPAPCQREEGALEGLTLLIRWSDLQWHMSLVLRTYWSELVTWPISPQGGGSAALPPMCHRKEDWKCWGKNTDIKWRALICLSPISPKCYHLPQPWDICQKEGINIGTLLLTKLHTYSDFTNFSNNALYLIRRPVQYRTVPNLFRIPVCASFIISYSSLLHFLVTMCLFSIL